MPAHFNSSCCLSRKEIKPQVVFLCSKWPPGDGLKLIPCVACCASESRGYWVFSYFVPSKLCLENQGLLGSTQSLWTKYPQLIQTRGNWTVIGLDLTFFFFVLLRMVFSLPVYKPGVIWSGLFIYLCTSIITRTKLQPSRKKRVCEGWWRGEPTN